MFRLGTTSYILPEDILPNVRYLAEKVQDVELVLFEVDNGGAGNTQPFNNLPSRQAVEELAALAQAHDLTYTIHLPLDLRLGAGGDEGHASLLKARKVIECTRSLKPWAYVLHLDGNEVRHGAPLSALQHWRDESVRALEIVAAWAGNPELLAVENLDHYPPDFTTPVLDRIPASRCVDIGHLWLEGFDPLPYLEAALPRTRVIHLHGIGARDHQSLALVAPEQLSPVFELLVRRNYAGVVTMEVFGEEDFHSSLKAVRDCLEKNLGMLR